MLHFLHIGKTGGSAIKHALEPYARTGSYVITLHPHRTRLRDVPSGEKIVFFLRDPVSRFLSSFYSRKREGRPRYYRPWSEEERAAFERFSTPHELATALSSEEEDVKAAAIKAMRSIKHVKSSYWDWFENETYFLVRSGDVLFVGLQERLNDDFERLKKKLGLPPMAELPQSDVEAHRAPPDEDLHLGEEGLHNLRTWYARDYAFLELCAALTSPAPE
jgi:hypothetical protein